MSLSLSLTSLLLIIRQMSRRISKFGYLNSSYRKMKEFCRMLKSVFERVIFLDKYPKSQIDLQVFVL